MLNHSPLAADAWFSKMHTRFIRLDCWSTALAQIVFYHKIKPFGKVQIYFRKGFVIHETMASSIFNFSMFSPIIDSSSSQEMVNQLSKYNYYAALAVQKEFGTDNYMNSLAPAELLEKHYRIKVKRYIAWHKKALLSKMILN